MLKAKTAQEIIDEKQAAKTARKRKLGEKEDPAPVTSQINFELLGQWIDVQADKLYKWIESKDEMITIKIDDSDYEWLVSGSEVSDDTAKADRPALGWTKIKEKFRIKIY